MFGAFGPLHSVIYRQHVAELSKERKRERSDQIYQSLRRLFDLLVGAMRPPIQSSLIQAASLSIFREMKRLRAITAFEPPRHDHAILISVIYYEILFNLLRID